MDKNNVAVKNNDHTVITEDRINEVFKLKFVNIGLGDGGDYTLVCTNDQGESTQTVNFYVHSKCLRNFIKRDLEMIEIDMSGMLSSPINNLASPATSRRKFSFLVFQVLI